MSENVRNIIGEVLLFVGALSLIGAMIFRQDMAPAIYYSSTTASSFCIGSGIALRFNREIQEFVDRYFGPWR